MNGFFRQQASFGFFDDSAGANALAIQNGERGGTVLMGKQLALSVLRGNEVALVVVLAHEWGHIKQYAENAKYNWAVRYELDADRQAGIYFAARWPDKSNSALGADLFSNLGDTLFSDPGHHGTPKQRMNVFLDGAGLSEKISVTNPLEQKSGRK